MTLPPGTRLGPYEILSPLGAGGMGEVYSARDTRLGREVAVKVLAERLAQDTEAVARFEREAKAVAALSHPNILAIHDFGNEGETVYAVTELLEGEDLRSRIAGSSMAVRRTVDIALQISRGLAAAHERGIVHRDLKPENVFLKQDGQVKILDFGLAKLLPSGTANSGTQAPTVEAGTEPGVVLGTIGYMAPEQVRGKPADHRTDIFAFGAILYEMLSGRRAFHGDTSADTMTAILKEDPPELSATQRNIPAALDRLVRHCLEKSPAQRFQSVSDVAYELEALSGATSSASAAARPAGFRDSEGWGRVAPLIGAAAIVGGVLAGHFAWKPRAAPPPSFRRLTYRRGNIGLARFAPDGQSVVYGASWEGEPVALYSTRIGNPESTPLGYPKASLMSISSSGELALSLRQIGLSGTGTVGTLARAPLGGGQPRPVLDFVDGADWSKDGGDLAIVRLLGGKNRIEFPTGNVLYSGGPSIDAPRFSPRGDRIAFVEQEVGGAEIAIVDLKKRLVRLPGRWQGVSSIAWGPAGESVWLAASGTQGDSTVFEIDLAGHARAALSIPDASTVDDVASDGRILLERYHSRRAIRVFAPGMTVERELTWFDLSDLKDMSEDAGTILFTERAAAAGIAGSFFLRKTDGSAAVKLGDGNAFALSPDGKFVLARPTDSPGLVLVPTGVGTPIRLDRGEIENFLGSWFFPDGKKILISGTLAGKTPRLYTQEIPNGRPILFSAEGYYPWGKPISPDGREVVVFRDWQEDIVILRFDGGPRRTIPNSKVLDPIRWATDGRSIYCVETSSLPARILKLDIATGKREPDRELSPAGTPTVVGVNNPILTADGRHYAYGYGCAATSDLYLVEGVK